MGVANVNAVEYPVPQPVVGRGALFVEHRLKAPQVSESAYIAPTAVLAGDVTVGPHSRVLFGTVITAEGGPVEIGQNCVIMENAVVRGVPGHETRIGDEVLVGPHAHLKRLRDRGRLADRDRRHGVQRRPHRNRGGGRVQCGGLRQYCRAGGYGGADGLVRRRTTRRTGGAGRLGPQAIMGPLDYPGTVFGVGASSPMPDIARRYARGLALHHRDHILPDERHLLAREDAS